MVEDRGEVFLAGKEVLRTLSAGSDRFVLVVVIFSLLVFVSRSSAMRPSVADVCLAAKVVRPAFGQLGAGDVGLKNLVDGSVVENDIAGWLVDAVLEGSRRELRDVVSIGCQVPSSSNWS